MASIWTSFVHSSLVWVPPKRRILRFCFFSIFRFSAKNRGRKTKNWYLVIFLHFWPIFGNFWWFSLKLGLSSFKLWIYFLSDWFRSWEIQAHNGSNFLIRLYTYHYLNQSPIWAMRNNDVWICRSFFIVTLKLLVFTFFKSNNK